MKKNYFFYMLFILLFFSCNNKNKRDILSRFDKIENINYTSFKFKNYSILHQLFGLLCVNNNLIAYDVDGKHYFSITNLETNTMLSKTVKHGQGPNEVASFPISVSIVDKNIFSFFERNKNILYEVNFKNPSHPVLQEKLLLNRNDGRLMTMHHLSPDFYFASGYFKKRKYLLLNKEGKRISYHCNYPKLPNDEKFTHAHKAMAFQGRLMSRPDGKRFFFAGSNSEVFEIIELTKNKKLNKIYEFHGEIGNYKPEDDGINTVAAAVSRKSRMKFVRASCTQNYIYLLYSNKIIEYGIYEAYLSDTIFFDWNVEPVKLFKLNTDVKEIGVDENDKTLYAIDPNSDSYLIKFLL